MITIDQCHCCRSTNPEDDAARRGSVQALVYSGDGKYIISGTKEGYILFWHLKRQVPLGIIFSAPVSLPYCLFGYLVGFLKTTISH